MKDLRSVFNFSPSVALNMSLWDTQCATKVPRAHGAFTRFVLSNQLSEPQRYLDYCHRIFMFEKLERMLSDHC